MVDQTYRLYKIIVVDDGPSDKTKGILREYNGQIRGMYQENRGPSAARNASINIAQGKYVLWSMLMTCGVGEGNLARSSVCFGCQNL